MTEWDELDDKRNLLLYEHKLLDESLERWGTFVVAWLLLIGPIVSVVFSIIFGFSWWSGMIYGVPAVLGLVMTGTYYLRTSALRKQVEVLNRAIKKQTRIK